MAKQKWGRFAGTAPIVFSRVLLGEIALFDPSLRALREAPLRIDTARPDYFIARTLAFASRPRHFCSHAAAVVVADKSSRIIAAHDSTEAALRSAIVNVLPRRYSRPL